jgi:hypothetical protein
VLRAYLQNQKRDLPKAEVALHRKHDGGEDRKPRAVYLDPALWSQFQEQARAEQVSAASLAESLLVRYLEGEDADAGAAERGAQPRYVAQVRPEELDPNRYVRVGDEVYDLGETPIIIDLKKEDPGA